MTRLTLDDVYEHINGVCFKTGPPGQVGAETEWFVVDPRNPDRHVRIDRLRALMDAAGPPPAGSRVTYEPGGQLELSSLPHRGVVAARAALAEDIAHVRRHLAAAGLELAGRGVDLRNLRAPLFQLDEGRYRCMRAYFGEAGLAMMCATASLQICLDIGADDKDAARRWRLAHALGPVLVAAFANSPTGCGRSSRQVIWEALDRGRTAPVVGEDPVTAWAEYALDARVMLLRDGWVPDPGMTFREWLATGRPDAGDLAYHLTTLFPPVRPHGYLEVRYLDTQPAGQWLVPVAVLAALLADPSVTAAARDACAPAAGRWLQAAERGLRDDTLAVAATEVFELACDALPALDAPPGVQLLVEDITEYRVRRGRCPADDLSSAIAAGAGAAGNGTRPAGHTGGHLL
jgi:glutamate--cysteine ligase